MRTLAVIACLVVALAGCANGNCGETHVIAWTNDGGSTTTSCSALCSAALPDVFASSWSCAQVDAGAVQCGVICGG